MHRDACTRHSGVARYSGLTRHVAESETLFDWNQDTAIGELKEKEEFIILIGKHVWHCKVEIDFQFSFVSFGVLHAPCLQKSQGDGSLPIDTIDAWWKETAALYHAHASATLCWVRVDANAGLASEATHLFGMHEAGKVTPQTECFEAFLQNISLYVPSTFACFHDGPSYTWTHSSGRRYRIDYVLANKAAFHMTQRTSIMTDYDGSLTHEDHLPAVLEARGWTQFGGTPDRIKWDEDALLDPVKCRQFQGALATLPLPTWNIHPNDHCALYETQLLALARQFFEVRDRKRCRPQLSQHTLDTIAMKRHVLDCGRAFHLMQDPEFKQLLTELEVQVRRLVRSDLSFLFDQLLVQMQRAGQDAEFKLMYAKLALASSPQA